MTEIRESFNQYVNKEAPKQLEKLFENLDENDGIMLQSCFEEFGEHVLEQRARAISEIKKYHPGADSNVSLSLKEDAKRNVKIGKKYSPVDADVFDIAVKALFYDMNDRKGFDTGDIPDDIVEEWKSVWKETLRQLFT